MVKRELNVKEKLLVYQSIYVPNLTYGQELCVITELRIQEVEMSFLQKVARVRSLVIKETPN